MKKVVKVLFVVFLMMVITACKKAPNKGTFFESIPMPDSEIEEINKIEKKNGKLEYILYVKDFTYEEFYNYIMSLEKLGFNYAFLSETIPEDMEKLPNKTEASWGANDGKIWIRALWRSKDNIYYDKYNLQLIFDDYDYMKPVEKAE